MSQSPHDVEVRGHATCSINAVPADRSGIDLKLLL
jgi:hypothetical protein